MLGTPRRTTVEGVDLAWTELGRGEPLLLLHGLGDSHRTWRRVTARLAERHRVLLLDLPGHGLSSRPDAPYTLDWYADLVHGWLDAIGVGVLPVVGHSFGGGVAQWMVLARRSRIDRLALVAPGGLGKSVTVGLRLASIPGLGRVLAQPLMHAGTHVMMRLGVGGDIRIEAEEVALSAKRNAAPGTGLAFHRTVAGCMSLAGQTVQSWDRIHEVETLPPLAVFWGDRDRILPIAHARHAQKRIEGAPLYCYPGVGHFVQLEVAEWFADDLLRFLRDPGDGPRIVDESIAARWRAWHALQAG
jgi:pimeloyl-ACP methyl ester carboxylesterase